MKGIKILLFAFIIGFIGLVNVEAETCNYNYSADGSTVTFTVYFRSGNISSTEFSGGVDTYKKIDYNDEGELVLSNAISTSVMNLKYNDFKNSDGSIDCSKVRSIYIDANVTSNSVWEIYNISTSSGSNIATTVRNAYPRNYLYSRIVGFSLSSNNTTGNGGFTQGGSTSEGSGVSRDEVVSGDWNVNNFCNGPVQGVFTTIGWVFFILKIVIPIILIVMGSVDLAKAVVASKDDEIKKAVGSLVKRAVLGILIFFIPTILSFVVELIGGNNIYDEESGTFGRCTYCMLNPSDCRKLAE